MRSWFFLIAMTLLLAGPARAAELATPAEITLTSHTVVKFATVAQARALLGARDEYVSQMSPFDFSLRLRTDRPVAESAYLARAAAAPVEWTPPAKARIAAAIAAVKESLNQFALPYPPVILMIETDGSEESNLAYTRANAIVLPAMLVAFSGSLNRVMAHESFHVLTRANPALREALYGCIGFKPCGEVTLPAGLKARKITNPDAPHNDFYCTVTWHGQRVAALPVLASKKEKYDPQTGGGVFAYIDPKLLLIEQLKGQWRPRLERGQPMLIGYGEVTGFYEQVGRNTQYIMEPEEILADNFALLITKQPPRSPEVLEKIRITLK